MELVVFNIVIEKVNFSLDSSVNSSHNTLMMNETKAAANKRDRMIQHCFNTRNQPFTTGPDRCEICEEAPATTTGKLVDIELCADCAATEPGTEGN